jgi:3-oxoacyl-[acyl-carrier protein] reductase
VSSVEPNPRVAVITGAAGGIGTGVARRMSERGINVAMLDASEAALADAAQQGTGSALPITCDVTDPDAMRRAAAEIEQTLGHVHVLFVNAGVGPSGGPEDTPDEVWNQTVSVNLTGAFNTVKAFVPVLRRSTGHRSIMFTSSVLALRGAGNMLAYSAAKSGVVGMVQSMSQQLAGYAITVNAIAPGPIRTPLLDAIAGDTLGKLESQVPLRRLGTPDDIANVVMFLTSAEASFIIGQVLAVDGGLSTRAYWRDA